MQLPTLSELLHKQMDRKQFLRTVGLMLLTILGFSALLRSLQRSGSAQQAATLSGSGNDTYGLKK